MQSPKLLDKGRTMIIICKSSKKYTLFEAKHRLKPFLKTATLDKNKIWMQHYIG